jgi:hypothetical protein
MLERWVVHYLRSPWKQAITICGYLDSAMLCFRIIVGN